MLDGWYVSYTREAMRFRRSGIGIACAARACESRHAEGRGHHAPEAWQSSCEATLSLRRSCAGETPESKDSPRALGDFSLSMQ